MKPLVELRRPLWLSMWMLLAACGGGGGGSPAPAPAPPPAPAPAPPPTPSAIVVSGLSPIAAACGIGGADTVFVNAEVEPMVATSPANTNLLVAAWQQDRAVAGGARAVMSATSSDGGRSWTRMLQPMSRCGGALIGSSTDFERATDPWVDVGADGTLHLMALGFNGAVLQPGSASAMLASRSTDGGRNWSTPIVLQRDGAAFFNDKNTLTADPRSLSDLGNVGCNLAAAVHFSPAFCPIATAMGLQTRQKLSSLGPNFASTPQVRQAPSDARYVYAVWDRLDVSDNGPTLFARSADAGLSWEPTRTIYTPLAPAGASQTIGNRIVVLGDGAERGVLVNIFVQIDNGSSPTLRVMRSLDKGVSWGAPITVAAMQSVGTRDPDSTATVRDGAIVPTVAAGPGGVLWLAWQDARFSGGQRDAIALSRSSDGGRSWSTPVAVNRDASVAAFTPTLHVRGDGRIGLLHYDLRSNTASTASLLADLWLLTSHDGVTWSETALQRGFDLGNAPTSRNGTLFLGDYHGLTSSGASFVAVAVLPNADESNRSDVVALRAETLAAALAQTLARHGVRAELPTLSTAQREAFAAAAMQATHRAMSLRRPQQPDRATTTAPPTGEPR